MPLALAGPVDVTLDLVVVLLLSNVVQNAIIGEDNSLLGGLIGALVLVTFNAVLDHWSMHSPRVAWLLSGKATQVVADGVVDHAAANQASRFVSRQRTNNRRAAVFSRICKATGPKSIVVSRR